MLKLLRARTHASPTPQHPGRFTSTNPSRGTDEGSLQKWNGLFFEKTTLRDLGLCVQLGHVPGSACVNPEPGPTEFTVIHTNGIHVINLNYCGCSGAGNRRQQLLRREWFPASQVIPQTCCTFRVLESFQTTSVQSKISAYDFYGAIAKLTDATGLDDMKVRVFLPYLLWVHLVTCSNRIDIVCLGGWHGSFTIPSCSREAVAGMQQVARQARRPESLLLCVLRVLARVSTSQHRGRMSMTKRGSLFACKVAHVKNNDASDFCTHRW